MELEAGDTVKVNGKRGTFTIAERIENGNGDGYRVISDKTLQNHFYRDKDIKPKKKKRRGRAA